MYRVFLSYNANTSRDEMVAVWRLQTLAAASGLQLYVPTPVQRADWATITRMIDDADSVIAFLTKRATSQVRKELEYALSRQKTVIPIVEKDTSTNPLKPLSQQSNIEVFNLDVKKPWEMEEKLADFLHREKVGKEARESLLALAGTFIGLYLLQQLTES
jgi:hypothetical protein